MPKLLLLLLSFLLLLRLQALAGCWTRGLTAHLTEPAAAKLGLVLLVLLVPLLAAPLLSAPLVAECRLAAYPGSAGNWRRPAKPKCAAKFVAELSLKPSITPGKRRLQTHETGRETPGRVFVKFIVQEFMHSDLHVHVHRGTTPHQALTCGVSSCMCCSM